MKHLLSSLLCLSIISTYAQENFLDDQIKLVLPQIETAKGIAETQISIPLKHTAFTQETADVTAEFWDTINYNPYKNEVVEFPFPIIFKDSTYASPIQTNKVITSRYGWRRGRPHRGIDLDLTTGDSVFAILDGVVRMSRYSRTFGHMVVVRHYNGLETTYAHLSKRLVKANDIVTKGQLLGKGGNTGRSAGSHLHLVTSYKGQYIHPEYIFEFSVGNKIRAKELWITKDWTRASFHSSKKLSKLDICTSEQEAISKLIKTRKVYTVKRGDTLSRISKRNRVSITSICKTNKIRKSSTLRIGQKLILEM